MINGHDPETALTFANASPNYDQRTSLEKFGLTVDNALKIDDYGKYTIIRDLLDELRNSQDFTSKSEKQDFVVKVVIEKGKYAIDLVKVLKSRNKDVKDALNFNADFQDTNGNDSPQWKVFKLGATISEALIIDSEVKYEALGKMINILKLTLYNNALPKAVSLTAKFTNEYQLKAFTEIYHSYPDFVDNALNFDNEYKIHACKIHMYVMNKGKKEALHHIKSHSINNENDYQTYIQSLVDEYLKSSKPDKKTFDILNEEIKQLSGNISLTLQDTTPTPVNPPDPATVAYEEFKAALQDSNTWEREVNNLIKNGKLGSLSEENIDKLVKNDISADQLGRFLLRIAKATQGYEHLEKFLKAGAKPNAKVNDTYSLLKKVVDDVNIDPTIIDLLIQYGADINADYGSSASHSTPLAVAVSAGNIKAVEKLLDAGADCTSDERHQVYKFNKNNTVKKELEELISSASAYQLIKKELPNKYNDNELKDLAKKFISQNQIEALKQVIINNQNPENAVDFTIPFTQGSGVVKDSPQFAALKLGFTVEQALKVTTNAIFNFVELLANDNSTVTSITNDEKLSIAFQCINDGKYLPDLRDVIAAGIDEVKKLIPNANGTLPTDPIGVTDAAISRDITIINGDMPFEFEIPPFKFNDPNAKNLNYEVKLVTKKAQKYTGIIEEKVEDLPDGLSFDPNTMRISGVPSLLVKDNTNTYIKINTSFLSWVFGGTPDYSVDTHFTLRVIAGTTKSDFALKVHSDAPLTSDELSLLNLIVDKQKMGEKLTKKEVEDALKSGAKVNIEDSYNKTIWGLIVDDGNTDINTKNDIFSLLLGYGSDVNYGITQKPLHVAASNNLTTLVKNLLKKGADPRLPDSYGKLPSELTTEAAIKNLLENEGHVKTLKEELSKIHYNWEDIDWQGSSGPDWKLIDWKAVDWEKADWDAIGIAINTPSVFKTLIGTQFNILAKIYTHAVVVKDDKFTQDIENAIKKLPQAESTDLFTKMGNNMKAIISLKLKNISEDHLYFTSKNTPLTDDEIKAFDIEMDQIQLLIQLHEKGEYDFNKIIQPIKDEINTYDSSIFSATDKAELIEHIEHPENYGEF